MCPKQLQPQLPERKHKKATLLLSNFADQEEEIYMQHNTLTMPLPET